LAPSTVRAYSEHIRVFLNHRFCHETPDLANLSAGDVVSFVQHRSACLHVKEAKKMTAALRSFLRYALYQGLIQTDLVGAVPAVCNWSKTEIPKSMPPQEVALTLASCNRETASGRRDYAILLLLSRLGLRASEVVGLTLDDIDWQTGCLTIRGKGAHVAQLPLPADVGEAMAEYLQRGRPKGRSRSLFLYVKAPLVGFRGQYVVGDIVERAMDRAGIVSPRKGAHQFRHSLATDMLRRGASIAEIGQVLRHRSAQTTEIYAKVDLVALRALALAWPGGAQ
jgi:site-specific recombinase XerD